MKLVVKLPNISSIADREAMLRIAQVAEALGYDTVWVADHVVIPKATSSEHPHGGAPDMSTSLDPLVSLGFVAACTERIRIGTSVLVLPYRNPLVTAKQLATIDVLSGGRLVVGAGAGSLEEEFEVLHAPPFRARGCVVEEWIEIFRACWEVDAPSHQGAHYAFPELTFRPKPRSRIPILLGGNSDVALRRAATIGDGWIGSRVDPSEVAERVSRLRRYAEDAGRDASDLTVACGYSVDGNARDFAGHAAELAAAGLQELELRFAAMRGDGASVDRVVDAMAEMVDAVRAC